jgi:hypothetical protein
MSRPRKPSFKLEFRLEAADAMDVGKFTVDKWVPNLIK